MKGYKIWVGLDKGLYKLATEWEEAIKQLNLIKKLFDNLSNRTCGIDEVEVGICKICKRVTLKEDLEAFGMCMRCENESYDAQRDKYSEEEESLADYFEGD